MTSPRSVSELDLSPIPGKAYWDCGREWREEFIYFLMVDRFHDGRERRSAGGSGRAKGSGRPEQLRTFCGGTLQGIRKKLDYIAGLGCTSLWLSPIFENNEGAYHGYAVQNYLDVDPRFGTKQDLVDLVDDAHRRSMRVILDVVANHSGDNWFYLGDHPYYYDRGRQFPFGGWRREDRPIPLELRNPDYYMRMGQICDWDAYPETRNGDFFSLKGYNNEDDAAGLELQEIMIRAHQYWIREADVDGFRMDAVKHMGELAVARFASRVREYAYSLGKREFFIFGELVGGDRAGDRYIGPNTPTTVGDQTVYFGLDSVLDFPLYHSLPGVVKGLQSPVDLINRYEALRYNAINRGELGRYLVTFLDNHDQIGADFKRRFAAGAFDEQVIAGIGFLLCALGTPCIYYGTEQGLSGEGPGDECIREALFDLDDAGLDYLNPECRIYQETAKIAAINRARPALRFGRMYMREVSGNGRDFGLPQGQPSTVAFSRVLADQEVLVVYNTSTTERRNDCVLVDSTIQKGRAMRFVYGGEGEVPVQAHGDPWNHSRFVRLDLAPMQFSILV